VISAPPYHPIFDFYPLGSLWFYSLPHACLLLPFRPLSLSNFKCILVSSFLFFFLVCDAMVPSLCLCVFLAFPFPSFFSKDWRCNLHGVLFFFLSIFLAEDPTFPFVNPFPKRTRCLPPLVLSFSPLPGQSFDSFSVHLVRIA